MAREEKVTVKKKVKNGALMSDGSIRISNVRFSYPHVVQPYESTNDAGKKTKKFKVTGMVPKDGSHDEVIALIEARMEALLKENKVRALPADKKFLRDGDEHEKEEMAGFMLVSASESKRPTLRRWDADEGRAVLVEFDEPEAEELFYGGAWGSIWINPWFQNSKDYGKRINANLWAVMHKRDDEAFGQGRISDEEVDEAFDDDDDEDAAPRRSAGKKPAGKKPAASKYEDDDDDDL